MKYFNVGLIGTGRMATEHFKTLKYFKNYKVTAVCSRNLLNSKKFAKKFSIPQHYNNLEKFLSNKYDLVIICVPPTEKFNIIKKVALKETNILMEKPLGLNFDEAKQITDYLKYINFKKNFFLGYNRRYLGSVLHLQNKLKKNTKPRVILVEDQQDIEKAEKIGHSKKVIKNWMYANSIHVIDLLNFFTRGKITKIQTKKIYLSKKKFIIFCKIKFSSGDICVYTAKWNITGRWSINIVSGKENYLLSPLEVLKVKNKSLVKDYKSFKMEKKLKPGFFYQFKEIDKVMNKKYGNVVQIHNAINSVNLVNKIYKNVQ